MSLVIIVVIVICTIVIVQRINTVIEMMKNINVPIKNLECLAIIYDYNSSNQTITVEPVEISSYNTNPEEFDIINHPEEAKVVSFSKAINIEIFDEKLESRKASLTELLSRLSDKGKPFLCHVIIKNGLIEEIYEQ
jgi:hypothetical protein